MVLLLFFASASKTAKASCRGLSKALVVDSQSRRLFLCEDGKAYRSFPVSIGRKGRGKRRAGDEKTPLGVYSLGVPRASKAGFGTFIDVGYPTLSQRKKGYTGSAIGIHGPKQSWRFLGPLSSLVDWTAGCIALASNREMDVIAQWVRKQKVKVVSIY
tara:strand:+ start:152 stop:625 length:474 start_codon:yes stop_codon:yes gene_type:complete